MKLESAATQDPASPSIPRPISTIAATLRPCSSSLLSIRELNRRAPEWSLVLISLLIQRQLQRTYATPPTSRSAKKLDEKLNVLTTKDDSIVELNSVFNGKLEEFHKSAADIIDELLVEVGEHAKTAYIMSGYVRDLRGRYCRRMRRGLRGGSMIPWEVEAGGQCHCLYESSVVGLQPQGSTAYVHAWMCPVTLLLLRPNYPHTSCIEARTSGTSRAKLRILGSKKVIIIQFFIKKVTQSKGQLGSFLAAANVKLASATQAVSSLGEASAATATYRYLAA